MEESNDYYRPIIKTEDFQLLYMYLMRVEMIGRHYRSLSKSWYNNSFDARALLDFYSWADEYFHFAEENMRKHLNPPEYAELSAAFTATEAGLPPVKDIVLARRIFQLFQKFGWTSGLLKLQTMTPVGKFGGVYAELGLNRKKKPSEEII